MEERTLIDHLTQRRKAIWTAITQQQWEKWRSALAEARIQLAYDDLYLVENQLRRIRGGLV